MNTVILFTLAGIRAFPIGLRLDLEECGISVISLRASMNWSPLGGVSLINRNKRAHLHQLDIWPTEVS